MFIELHRFNAAVVTVNLDKIEYFVPAENGTAIRLSNHNGWLEVTETYDKVKELIADVTRK